MKNVTQWHIVLCALMIVSGVCFGAQPACKLQVMKERKKTNDLLLPKYDVIVRGDSIVFRSPEDRKEKIKLYDQKNIKKIYDAFSKRKAFVVKFVQNENLATKKVRVQEYRSGSFLWWNGWVPYELHFVCLGMPEHLGVMNDRRPIEINLGEDKKSLPTYKRNKKIGYFLVAMPFIAILYCLRNQIGSMLCE